MPDNNEKFITLDPKGEMKTAKDYLSQSTKLPAWLSVPIPGDPEKFSVALSDYNTLKEGIGIENITGAMDVLDSGDPEKILAFAKTMTDRPDLQEAMRRMAKYL